jgi:peptidoglycan-associated lipoprotein
VKTYVSMAATGLLLLLGACSSTPVDTSSKTNATAPNASSAANPRPSDATSGKSPTTMRASALPAHLDPNSPLTKGRSVYFAFDEAILDQEDLGIIEKHGKYLAAMPSLKVKIEGNADERGSAEYNLALGQKRAEATMKALKLVGVRESQMEAISWGEEHPQDKGHDETAHSHNRRADIVYPKP